MQTQLKVQLSAFMFLQYFIWGSWYVTLGSYLATQLKFDGPQIGYAYGAFAIGSMISPFFVGLIADRYFASEKLLAVLGILGGLVICLLPQMHGFGTFYPMLITYCALFTPTLALGNSLALHHLRDARRDFPQVKTLSAVGWIAGGLTLTALRGEQSAVQFYLAGAVSIAFGLFSLTLPHTPPKKVGANVSIGEVLGLDALALMRKPSFAIFIVCMFLICVPLYFYFVNMGIYLSQLEWGHAAGWMTLAQVSDVAFLVLLAVMLKRLGYKVTIAIGILAWAGRYFLLAGSVGASTDTILLGDRVVHVNVAQGVQTLLIFGAILVHGVCYDFLFIAGQLYVDDQANARMRGAAQGLIAFILWGVGNFVGTLLAGYVQGANLLPAPAGAVLHDWRWIWLTPALLATGVLVVFLIFFRESRPPASVELPREGTALDEAPL